MSILLMPRTLLDMSIINYLNLTLQMRHAAQKSQVTCF